MGSDRMQQELLSKKETSGLKGVLAVMVLVSHLSARVELFSYSILGTMFSAFGYLAVSMFFFVSGFGLYARYKQCGSSYIRDFPRRKVLPFYAMCLCVILIYLLRDLAFTGTTDWLVFAQSFLFGKTVVDLGWYLQAQTVLYIMFYAVFRLAKQKKILLMWLFTGVYCVICVAMELSSTWYEAVLCFPLGLSCAEYQNAIIDFFQTRKRAILCACGWLILFLITLLFGNKQILPEFLRIVIKIISTGCFAGLMITAMTQIKTANPVTVFLGNLSFEIYVLQGLFLTGLRPVIANDWLYMAAVTVAVILLSMAAHPVLGAVSKGTAKLGKRKTADRKE